MLTSQVTRRATRAVSQLGLGCAPVGQLNSRLSASEAEEILSAAHESGISYYDTAPLYGFGLSELRVGSFLRELPRDSYFLTTKVGRYFSGRPGEENDPGIWAGGLREFHPTHAFDGETISRSFEQSQLRLGLARADAVLLHDLDRWNFSDAEVEEGFSQLRESGWGAMEELRSSGLAPSGLGAGMNEVVFGDKFLEFDFDFFLIAGRLTLLENTAAKNHPDGPDAAIQLGEFLEELKRRGISVVVGGVFNSGVLVTGTGAGKPLKHDYAPASAAVVEATQRIEAVCNAHDVPLPAAALQYPLRHPSGVVSTVLPGADTPQQVRQNAEWFNTPIPQAFWDQLREEGIAD